jgi:hypothetical protein
MPAVSTTIAKPRWMRKASNAEIVPVGQFQVWHDQAVQMPGLTDLDRKMLGVIAAWYRRLYVEEFAGSLSYQRIAQHLETDSVNVRWAVNRLVELGLLAVKPGAGGRANTYLPCLPRRLAAPLSTAAADDDAPPV